MTEAMGTGADPDMEDAALVARVRQTIADDERLEALTNALLPPWPY